MILIIWVYFYSKIFFLSSHWLFLLLFFNNIIYFHTLWCCYLKFYSLVWFDSYSKYIDYIEQQPTSNTYIIIIIMFVVLLLFLYIFIYNNNDNRIHQINSQCLMIIWTTRIVVVWKKYKDVTERGRTTITTNDDWRSTNVDDDDEVDNKSIKE